MSIPTFGNCQIIVSYFQPIGILDVQKIQKNSKLQPESNEIHSEYLCVG